ncbi:hypothetical protein, partial [Atopomonas sediminilitoris]|uniref:hypothetical protein n=1 Tax=Atopomonas sediminilitoris TaxID=2919919 RepID=UPI001F4DAB0E
SIQPLGKLSNLHEPHQREANSTLSKLTVNTSFRVYFQKTEAFPKTLWTASYRHPTSLKPQEIQSLAARCEEGRIIGPAVLPSTVFHAYFSVMRAKAFLPA